MHVIYIVALILAVLLLSSLAFTAANTDAAQRGEAGQPGETPQRVETVVGRPHGYGACQLGAHCPTAPHELRMNPFDNPESGRIIRPESEPDHYELST